MCRIEKLQITKDVLMILLHEKEKLQKEADLQNSEQYGLDLPVKYIKSVLEMLDDKIESLEDMD